MQNIKHKLKYIKLKMKTHVIKNINYKNNIKYEPKNKIKT